jgi:triacylglycerol lipase
VQYDPTISALIHPERQQPLGREQPWNEAAMLAECARLAYVRFENGGAAEQTLKSALAAFGYGDVVGFFVQGKPVGKFRFDTQAFGAVSVGPSTERTALVVFRGTRADSFPNIVSDALFLPTSWAGVGKVHTGFWLSLAEALGQIQSWLDNVRPSRLIVTGHSLGAAQASLLAALRKQAKLVTFGSPLVGDDGFAASFSGREVARYVDTIDIVTRVPPLIYRHLDGLQYIDRHGKIHPGGLPGMAGLADRLAARLDYLRLAFRQGNCPARALADHAPINYVSAMVRSFRPPR